MWVHKSSITHGGAGTLGAKRARECPLAAAVDGPPTS
nr:hypothetical protein [Tanacetum cinerariifolium]